MEGFLIGRIRGIEVRLNWSVVFVALLIAWSLAETVLPEMAEGSSDGAYWAAGVMAAVVFLASLFAHELGHSIVALGQGVPVTSITLWMFGGVAVLGAPPTEPASAMRIATAGPVVSGVIGVVVTIAALFLDGLAGSTLLWLGLMNLVLMAFNLLPAFPLDGGRIYQAWQWQKTGDELQSIKRAAELGLKIGAMLVAIGLIEIVLLGSLIGGLWMMAIGWFVREAGRAEWRHHAVEKPLATFRVRQVMSADPLTVDARITLDEFVAGVFFGGRHAAYPVTGPDGVVTGMVTLNTVRATEHRDHATITVGEVAVGRDQLVETTPDTPVDTLLAQMQERQESRALVFDGDRLVGIVAPSDITRLLSVLEASGTIETVP